MAQAPSDETSSRAFSSFIIIYINIAAFFAKSRAVAADAAEEPVMNIFIKIPPS